MASCDPTPTLTVFPFVTSATTITSFTLSLQTQPDGSVSTVTLPLIKTSIITLVNQSSTVYASCSSSSSPISPGVVTTPISTISQSTMTSPQPSSTPATDTITTIHQPNVTGLQITFSQNPPPMATYTSASTPIVLPTGNSASGQTSNIAPIVGGAVGGFFFFIGVVAIAWFIWKKSRKFNAVMEEKDLVFPYPVTRGGDQSKQLELTNESRP